MGMIAAVLLALASTAPEAPIRRFDIPAQPLAGALLQLSRQGNINILASEGLTRGRTAPAVRGAMSPMQAIERVLARSGLSCRTAADGTLIITPRSKAEAPCAPSPPPRIAIRPPVSAQHDAIASTQDIVVMAQRRFENSHDIPIAVSAFRSEALAAAGISKSFDLQQLDSSLVISAQSGVIIPFLRGIGNPASSTPGNESSVPIYIDDVYFARLYPAYLSLEHVDRVEILKGPQGTLFGRNATGGLIQMFTREPGDQPDLDVEIGLANYGTVTGKAYVAGPLGEDVAANISASARKQTHGWGRNLHGGGRTYYTDYYNIRSKLILDLSDSTRLRVAAFYVAQNASQGEVQGAVLPGYLRGLPPGYQSAFDPPAGFFDLNTDHPSFHHHRGFAGSVKLDHGFGFADLTSISAYRRSKETWHSEGDLTYIPYLSYALYPRDREISQELQLKSKPQDRISWILGLYYLNAFSAIDPTSVSGDAITSRGIASLNLIGRQTIKSYALFGQGNFPVIDGKTHLTLGARYTRDRVEGLGRQYSLAPDGRRIATMPDYRDTESFNKITYRFAVDRRFSDQLMAYGSASRGYKSGTFNTLPLDSPALRPETVDAYEVGLKARFLAGRLRFNIAAYRNDIKNPQVQIVRNVAGVAINQFANADRARTRGIEFDGAFKMTSALTIRIAGQYLDAKFIRFVDAPINTPLFMPPFGVVTAAGDASGNRTPHSPRLKLNIGFEHGFDTGIGAVSLNGNLAYRGSFKWEPDNVITQPALTLVNAGVALQPASAPNMRLRLWSNNLTNRRYYSNMLTQSGPVGFMASPAEPRTYGLELRYRL